MKRSIALILAVLTLAACDGGGLYGNSSESSYGSSNY